MALWLFILAEASLFAGLQPTPLRAARQAARVANAQQSAFDDSFVDSASQKRKKPK
jgi:hypothetical protein